MKKQCLILKNFIEKSVNIFENVFTHNFVYSFKLNVNIIKKRTFIFSESLTVEHTFKLVNFLNIINFFL